MDHLLKKLEYSFFDKDEIYRFPDTLIESVSLIKNFFEKSQKNKICLVFPAKELVAQWISLPITLFQIEKDFNNYKNEIFESYKSFKPGDKLILNNSAIVQWIGIEEIEINGIRKEFGFYLTKATKKSPSIKKSILLDKIFQLQPSIKNKLSSQERVLSAKKNEIESPTDKILNFKTYGNKNFLKNKICLVTKYNSYQNSIEGIHLNNFPLNEYIQIGKIDENGNTESNTPLIITNNLSNLALYSPSNNLANIIIDGFKMIEERGTDFSDIDVKNIPTILITDLSEIESFETIGNYGFEFFNFTKENLKLDHSVNLSPFHSFEKKLRKYISFNVVKEICKDPEIEAITQKIYSIEKDESNNDLTLLKISLIQLTNFVSRVAHIPTTEEISVLNFKINSLETLFLSCRMWLGDSHKLIEESIFLLKSVIVRFATQQSEKCVRLKTLMSTKQYDYIICTSEEEANALNDSLPPDIQKPKVISVADVNDKLLSNKPLKAILTGWAKSNNINRILSSFLFSELTVLFYQFENKYYNSLQRRNKQYSENIKGTISIKGNLSETDSAKQKGFSDLYSSDEISNTTSESSFDILDFEFTIDNAQYSKYAAKGNLIDSIKARRIVFESDLFIYTTESHKFLLINELIERKETNANLYRRKVETLQTGDVIALINTDRDILVELVERNTNVEELASVKKWTELWKKLLREYYASIGNDFKKLIEELRKNGCKKHEVTIRTWLQDESRIGPNDDADLISIAILTNSNVLLENIGKVRDSISKMVGWRMQAADFVSNQIKSRIYKIVDESFINTKVEVAGLGSVTILKITEISKKWEEIDVRYVNRLLQKEII